MPTSLIVNTMAFAASNTAYAIACFIAFVSVIFLLSALHCLKYFPVCFMSFTSDPI